MKLNMNTVVRAILNKRKPQILAVLDKPKKKSLIIYGKRVQPKPEAVKPIKVAPPKPKAVIDTEEREIMNLIHIDPIKALQMAHARDNRMAKERRERVRFLALSPLEIEREQERKEIIKTAAISLIANLPKVREIQLDINWKKEILLQHIADAAFRSSLESNFLWIGGGNFGGILKVKSGAITVEVDRANLELLDTAASKIFAWSGVLKSLDNPTASDLKRYLSVAADNYAVSQRKLKPSEYYLSQLVEKAIKAPLLYTKETATRTEIMAALALATAEVGVAIGFIKDSQKHVNIDCSDNRFGNTQLTAKVMLPYFQSIIDGSSVAGRLTSLSDASKLLAAFINHLPK